MACNVFGTPVTLETLKGIPEYADKTITTKELAEVALAMKNAEGKDVNARSYVEKMYTSSYENLHCALGLIYNATGARLEFCKSWDLYGFLAPAPYPALIENGQWGAFLCVTQNKDPNQGAAGSVTYGGIDPQGKKFDLIVAWDTREFPGNTPLVLAKIDFTSQYDNAPEQLWESLKEVNRQDTRIEEGTVFATAMMGSGKMGVLEVIAGLK